MVLASVTNAFPVNAGKRPPCSTQALPAKSYVALPCLIAPGNTLSSCAAVAKSDYPVPLTNWNLTKERNTSTEKPGPSWLGVGCEANHLTP